MTTLAGPVRGAARIVVLSSDPHVVRGSTAEFRHFGASLVLRADVVSALTEVVRDPDTILLVCSDVDCQDMASVLELALATSRSTVLFGVHPAGGLGALGTAVAAGVGGIVDLPVTPERLVAALRDLPVPTTDLPGPVTVGGLVVDRYRHRVELFGTPIPTTPREFDILLALATSYPGVVTLDRLAGGRGRGAGHRASVRVMVAGLRSRFSALTGVARDAVIETQRGVGYRLGP